MATIWDKPFSQDTGVTSASNTNPFFQPGSTYGATSSWNDSPLSGQIREQNPQLAFTQYGQNLGVQDNDQNFNRWFFQQFPRFQRAYGMATLQNPLITIDQFLGTMPGLDALKAQYQMLSPNQRGEQQANFAPIPRWITR